MDLDSIIKGFTTILLPLSGTIAMISWAWSNWRSGNSKNQLELIATLTGQLKAQKDINDTQTLVNQDLQKQISETKREMGILEGQNKLYEKILQNRDPRLEETLTYLKTVAEQAVVYMANNPPMTKGTTIVKEIKKVI